tara:strand:- start:696 stop:3089 length:2394 start_codon:yes stop_codon:yes gene_type:complete
MKTNNVIERNLIAKLLAEEDIFVVRKQMPTAYFDVKARELGLPIWKDNTMDDIEEELLICHEIGHALWTPLDMLEKSSLRKLEHSVVNVLEDARIEKKVMNKYLGSVRIFKDGYNSLSEKDFFSIKGKKLNAKTFNLIDRINLFFKLGDTSIEFLENEKIWVKKAGETKTPEDVLDLAEELMKFMTENPESMGDSSEGDSDESGDFSDASPMMGSGSSSSGEEGEESEDVGKALADAIAEGDGEKINELTETLKELMENAENDDKSATDTNSNDDGDNLDSDGTSGKEDDAEESSDKENLEIPETDNDVITGGDNKSSGAGEIPKAKTDSAFGEALEKIRDKDASDVGYARIPDTIIKEATVPYKTVVQEMGEIYEPKSSELYFTATKTELEEMKKTSKKTVAYMVKEFEMKKSADQYARAAVSKTGSLDMGKLHTYKYNEDLFKKVTTLPGATNHGLFMIVDWSGSMASNLKSTISQLFNLVWFCRRTKIPFEVYAFSDQYVGGYNERDEFKGFSKNYGEMILTPTKMLNLFSSKMSIDEEMKVMHYLIMFSSQWGYRDWKTEGYPIYHRGKYNLGGTPLNEAIIASMKLIPEFVKETGVQKINTVFLTDGAGHCNYEKYDHGVDTYERSSTYGEQIDKHSTFAGYGHSSYVITDPKTNKTISKENRHDQTSVFLDLLRHRVPEMNIVGFFIAGSGKSGKVSGDTLRYLGDGYKTSSDIKNMLKTLKKDNVLAVKEKGFDEYYILPGAGQLEVENFELGEDLVGASKAKLKSAFSKSANGRISSRPLLNKFISMVA